MYLRGTVSRKGIPYPLKPQKSAVRILLKCFLVCLLECATQDAFTVLPTNTAGMIGQNVTLNCALSNGDYSLIWRNPSRNNVYLKGIGITSENEGHYLVEEGSGNNYNLVVVNADESDAGRYECDCPTVSSSALAEIILLGEKNTPYSTFSLIQSNISNLLN